jgi:hypothetical protein
MRPFRLVLDESQVYLGTCGHDLGSRPLVQWVQEMIEMPVDTATATRPTTIGRRTPFRRTFVLIESLVALGGLMGTAQLLTGTFTPPLSVLGPLGLSSWMLPGLWLFGTVVVPSAAAAILAWRRSSLAPPVVLLASATLALELLVQIPFLGPSLLQVVFGTIAIAMAALALRARRTGWPASRPRRSGR